VVHAPDVRERQGDRAAISRARRIVRAWREVERLPNAPRRPVNAPMSSSVRCDAAIVARPLEQLVRSPQVIHGAVVLSERRCPRASRLYAAPAFARLS